MRSRDLQPLCAFQLFHHISGKEFSQMLIQNAWQKKTEYRCEHYEGLHCFGVKYRFVFSNLLTRKFIRNKKNGNKDKLGKKCLGSQGTGTFNLVLCQQKDETIPIQYLYIFIQTILFKQGRQVIVFNDHFFKIQGKKGRGYQIRNSKCREGINQKHLNTSRDY